MNLLKRNNGQFVPITAMIAFSAVVFMVATVNIYKISRAKLRVQNLADAAALNLASQKAQAFNIIADRNEWLNHMMAGEPSPSKTGDCSRYVAGSKRIPPIACVENVSGGKSRHIFFSRSGAINYASVVQTVNEAQRLFQDAYNKFLGKDVGAGSASAVNADKNFSGLLKQDIPELRNPKISLIAWDTGDVSTRQAQALARNRSGDNVRAIKMGGIKFQPRDIRTAYQTEVFGKIRVEKTSFMNLLYGKVNHQPAKGESKYGPLYGQRPERVGWMVPANDMPRVNVKGKQLYGVGVAVTEQVDLGIFGTKPVTAKAVAYLVPGSGNVGQPGGVPRFEPTYWAKLAH